MTETAPATTMSVRTKTLFLPSALALCCSVALVVIGYDAVYGTKLTKDQWIRPRHAMDGNIIDQDEHIYLEARDVQQLIRPLENARLGLAQNLDLLAQDPEDMTSSNAVFHSLEALIEKVDYLHDEWEDSSFLIDDPYTRYMTPVLPCFATCCGRRRRKDAHMVQLLHRGLTPDQFAALDKWLGMLIEQRRRGDAHVNVHNHVFSPLFEAVPLARDLHLPNEREQRLRDRRRACGVGTATFLLCAAWVAYTLSQHKPL